MQSLAAWPDSSAIRGSDGNPDFIENNLVNFQKRYRMAAVIQQLLKLQQVKYKFSTENDIMSKLLALQPKVDETKAYTLSLKIEPRDTSEAIEKLMIEEERLRLEVDRLTSRLTDVEVRW